MFEKLEKLFNENSVKNCHFIYLKKNGNEFESNSISFGKSHWNNKQDLNGDHIFRRNELISIDYEDLEFVSEGLKITIRRSKTDQFGEGMIKGLPYFSNKMYCPIINLKKWLEISKIKSGPIFRRFTKGSTLTEKRLTDQSVVLLIKKYLNLAGIENKNFAGHSLRSGFATVAAESGADERSIMAMTGHKTSQMVRRYIKEANLFKNNALNKLKI